MNEQLTSMHSHLNDDVRSESSGGLLLHVAVDVVVADVEAELEAVANVDVAGIGPGLAVYLSVEQPVGRFMACVTCLVAGVKVLFYYLFAAMFVTM